MNDDKQQRRQEKIEKMRADLAAARAVLGLPKTFTIGDVQKARRERIKSAHPDKGGDLKLSQTLNAAADFLIKRLNKEPKRQSPAPPAPEPTRPPEPARPAEQKQEPAPQPAPAKPDIPVAEFAPPLIDGMAIHPVPKPSADHGIVHALGSVGAQATTQLDHSEGRRAADAAVKAISGPVRPGATSMPLIEGKSVPVAAPFGIPIASTFPKEPKVTLGNHLASPRSATTRVLSGTTTDIPEAVPFGVPIASFAKEPKAASVLGAHAPKMFDEDWHIPLDLDNNSQQPKGSRSRNASARAGLGGNFLHQMLGTSPQLGGNDEGIGDADSELLLAIKKLTEAVEDLAGKLSKDSSGGASATNAPATLNLQRTVSGRSANGRDLISQAASSAPGIEWANTVERWFASRFGRRE